MPSYNYELAGTASEGQTWKTSGVVTIDALGRFPEVPEVAMIDTFGKLTKGKAVFGKPGIGCRGPYRITRLLIEENTDTVERT